jgi:hypothetical protein
VAHAPPRLAQWQVALAAANIKLGLNEQSRDALIWSSTTLLMSRALGAFEAQPDVSCISM